MKNNKCYNNVTIILFLLINVTINAQFSLVEEFDSFGGVGEWTIDNGGGVQNYGGAENYLSFNLGSTPYLNSSTITATSPVHDLSTISGNATVNFPISGIIENNWDYMYFDYFDGGVWVNDTVLTGLQTTTIVRTTIPNTVTQFRFRLVTDPSFIIWYRNNGSWWWSNTGGFNTPVDISNSYVTGVNPITTSVYYYDISQFTIKGTLTLPIELISFNAVENKGDVVLKWVTASEVNNDRFEVYRSEDGVEWELIGTEDGAGNSNVTLEYYFIDRLPNQVNYYKLKQVDYDGNNEYSDMVFVGFNSNSNGVGEGTYIYYNVMGQEVTKDFNGPKFKKEKL